jgi:glutathione S-transferase/alpha,alpha-trehalase
MCLSYFVLCRYDTGLKKPNRRIDVLDRLLSQQDYLVQGEFTVADVAVAAYFLYVLQFFPSVDLSRWPNVVNYLQRCASRTAYGQAFGTRVQTALELALARMG